MVIACLHDRACAKSSGDELQELPSHPPPPAAEQQYQHIITVLCAAWVAHPSASLAERPSGAVGPCELNGIYKSKCSLCPHKRRPRRAGGSESLASLPAMSALFWRQLERLVRSRAPSEDIKPNSQTTKSSSPSFMESINFVTSSATCFKLFKGSLFSGSGSGGFSWCSRECLPAL